MNPLSKFVDLFFKGLQHNLADRMIREGSRKGKIRSLQSEFARIVSLKKQMEDDLSGVPDIKNTDSSIRGHSVQEMIDEDLFELTKFRKEVEEKYGKRFLMKNTTKPDRKYLGFDY